MNRRRGVSLIELIVVLGIGAVMMGVCVTLLYAVLRTDGVGREHVRHSIVLARLADQFRRDVHAAKTVTGVADGEQWKLELPPGRTVTYRLEAGVLARSEQVDGTVQRRESFTLPSGTTASIEIQAEAEPTVVSLMIVPVAEATGQPAGRAVQIDAVLARDHRFAGPPEPEGEESE